LRAILTPLHRSMGQTPKPNQSPKTDGVPDSRISILGWCNLQGPTPPHELEGASRPIAAVTRSDWQSGPTSADPSASSGGGGNRRKWPPRPQTFLNALRHYRACPEAISKASTSRLCRVVSGRFTARVTVTGYAVSTGIWGGNSPHSNRIATPSITANVILSGNMPGCAGIAASSYLS
jgi:hypothetical protein